MKKTTGLRIIIVAIGLAMAPLVSTATTFFSDTFVNGSTLNAPVTIPPTNLPVTATCYQTLVNSIVATNGTASLAAGDLRYTLSGSSVLGEVMGLFANTNSPIALAQVGNQIEIDVVFTDTLNLLSTTNNTANSTLNIGLFNSGNSAPNTTTNNGSIMSNSNAPAFNGGTAAWTGYIGRIFLAAGNCSILARQAQGANPGTTSQNQDLLFSNASSTGAFNNPAGSSLGTTTPSGAYNYCTNGMTYTLSLVVALTNAGTYTITNTLYAGAGTGGSIIFRQSKTATSGGVFPTAFDGFAIGWRNASAASQLSTMDIASIQVYGLSSITTNAPDIITNPVSAMVATNGSGAFSVSAIGLNMTYQWHRNGTNLFNGANISGANSSMLTISPAGLADVFTNYYVTVTGLGGYTTNSTNCSLILRQATNLVWTSGGGNTWDVNNTISWQNPDLNATVFNYGDPVTFDDTASSRIINLSGAFLAAGSVTVDSIYKYTFQGSGKYAGAGSLLYKGSGMLDIKNANSYTGGTTISNSSADLYLEHLDGLGTGPVTLVSGMLEVTTNGNSAANGIGIAGDVVVTGDSTIQLNGNGSYCGNFLGNISGLAGTNLTINMLNTGTNGRIRFYGTNSVMNANMSLNGASTSQAQYYGFTLAPYHPTGNQYYNGVISGNGGIIQRGGGTTVLSGQNTYTGGTIPTTGVIAIGTNSTGSPTVTSGPLGTSPLFLAPEQPNLTGDGTIIAWGSARTVGNNIQYPSGTNTLTLHISGNNALNFTGPITLNGDDGSSTYSNRVFEVTNTALTTFSGVISGTGFGLIKTGNSVLALNNTETYTGATTVSNGTLQVNGALDAASAVTVTTNGILGGTGTVNGPVTIQAYGTLAPGASVGTLTISNNLTLNGNLFFELNKSLNPSNDICKVTGTLINGGVGTLTVTNLGPALVAGDKFKLFSQAMTGGGSLTISGGGSGVTWNNNLTTDGSISVASLTVPRPVITNTVASGSSIVFSGTNGTGSATYYVLSSTDITTPLASWTVLLTTNFAANGGFSVTLPVSAGVPQRFYLLQVP
jgi:autotransporter-associated beta strand protein